MSEIFVTAFGWWDEDVDSNGDISSSLYENECKHTASNENNSILLTLLSRWRTSNNNKLHWSQENLHYDNNDAAQTIDNIDQQQQYSNIKKQRKTKKNLTVQFSNVEIREYNVTLGDHPKVKLYPISLDWKYNENAITMDLDEHIDLHLQKQFNKMSEQKLKIQQRRAQCSIRLKAPERFKRITDVTGMPMIELYNLEVIRHEQLEIELEQLSIIDNDDNEGGNRRRASW